MSTERRFICLVVDVDSLEAAQAQIFTPDALSLFPRDLIESLTENDWCEITSIWEYEAGNPEYKATEFVEAFMEYARGELELREAEG